MKEIENEKIENRPYLTKQIITYIGNKRSLIPYIEKEIKIIQKRLKVNKTINLDLFSGSGVVARLMKKYSSKLYVNDLELYSKVINECYLSNYSSINWEEYEKYVKEITLYLNENTLIEGTISKYYSPKDDENIKLGERAFYTSNNAKIIDTIRKALDDVDEPYKTLILGQLLYEASVKTNTAGVFKGFYKDSKTSIGKFGGNGEYALKRIKGKIKLQKPVLSSFDCDFKVFQQDSNTLVRELKGLDIVYIDPPYNQHPYGANYFMLNLIVTKEEPKEISKVSGIPKNWNKSLYNYKKSAFDEFEDLISNIDSKYVIISYNSEGFISKDAMLTMLKKYGAVDLKEIVYNTYRGSRNLAERNLYVNEYLFILRKEVE